MKISNLEYILDDIQTPCYVCEEALVEQNLQLLDSIQQQTGVKILLALKAFAFNGAMHLVQEYLHGCCASGLHEAKYAKEFVGKEVHTFSPAFKDEDMEEILNISNHIVFNSFNQLRKFKDQLHEKNSVGLRVNPEVSTVEVDLYNPCGLYSRLGTTYEEFEINCIETHDFDIVEGLHFHALCEQNVDALKAVLEKFETKFSKHFDQLKWVNFGGGHHITREDYDVAGLIKLLQEFKARYPHLEVYMEPGEAVGWQTGTLVATVLDIVHNKIDIAILDTSAECHMPDTLAMPYTAEVRGATIATNVSLTNTDNLYRLAGNTCLAGDVIGDYIFDKPLQIGDKIIFEDQIHYTIVKNTTFNGIKLPDLIMLNKDKTFDIIRKFGYDEYKNRN